MLIVAEAMAGAAGAEPMGDAYFGLYLLAMGSGWPRTPKTDHRMLCGCGIFGHPALADAHGRCSCRLSVQTEPRSEKVHT